MAAPKVPLTWFNDPARRWGARAGRAQPTRLSGGAGIGPRTRV